MIFHPSCRQNELCDNMLILKDFTKYSGDPKVEKTILDLKN
jgi:hypothetical protein